MSSKSFRHGLGELGYVEGQNIAIESRWAEGKYDRLPGLAAELVRLKVDVIVTAAVPAIQAAKEATRTIPIVMAVVVDPVATGLVASLARPGEHHGVVQHGSRARGKAVGDAQGGRPQGLPGGPSSGIPEIQATPQLREAEVAARTLGMRLQSLEARGPSEIDSAFAAMTKERAGAVIVLVDVMFIEPGTRIADLAAKSRLPAVYGLTEHVEAGGLMAYGANVSDLFRRAAAYVDKILKGAKPADLPMEQPTKFELVINLKTAKALGLTIPPSLLGSARIRVIQ